MPLAAPTPTYSEDLYRFHWPALGIECLLERFADRRDDIAVELTVNLDHPLLGGRLYSGRLLLIGPNSRRDVQRTLDSRFPEADWEGILEQVCNLARERYRRGEPPIDLAAIDASEQPPFALYPFVVRNGIGILFGDGGTGKSIVALWWCVQLALKGIASFYLDWEDDAPTHNERLSAICNALGVPNPSKLIFYQRRTARLAESVREIRRFIAEKSIDHGVIDSVGMAAGDPNDHGLMLDAVRAARSLGISVTLIHHLPKDAKDKTKPFGSVYASNEARLTWLIEKTQEEGEDELAVLLTNPKHNRGRLYPRQAYKVRFVNDEDGLVEIAFEQVEVSAIDAFRPKMKQRLLIAEVLKANGRLTTRQIQDCLAAEGVTLSLDHIGAVLRRWRGRLFVELAGTWAVQVINAP